MMKEHELIVVEPGDLVLISGCADSPLDSESLAELRKELPNAKVFGFEGQIKVQLLHGESDA